MNIIIRNTSIRWRCLLGTQLIWLSLQAHAAVSIPAVNLKSNSTAANNTHKQMAHTHFSQTEIAKSPVANLSEFLRQQQSVVRLTNSSGDASQTAFSIRGFGDNAAANSLILIDGFPLLNPSLLAPNFNSIPLTDIQRIDIYQGSQGSLWGDQAVGGVVNIVTKHPKEFSFNFITGIGSYSNNYYNVLIGAKAPNGLFFKTFGAFGQTHNYRAHNHQDGDNIAAQIGWDYTRGTISLNLQTYTDTTYFPGGLSEEQFHKNPRQATEFNNFSHYTTNLYQLFNRQQLSEKWLLETRVDHHETNGNGFVYLNYHRNDALTNIHPRLIGAFGSNKIIAGYLGQATRYELQNIKVHSRTHANENDIYAQAVIPLREKVDLTLGVRGAEQSNQVEQIVGQVAHTQNSVFVSEQGLAFKPLDQLSLFVRRDGNFSFPKANEQTWIPDNVSSLRVQTGVSYEAGVEWVVPQGTLQLSLYRLDLNNEIAFNPAQTDVQPFGAFNNLDPTRRTGISIIEKTFLTPKLTISKQINYVNARFVSGAYAGHLIPAVPAVNGNLAVNYAWTERWQTQYILLYTGSRYASEDLENIGKRISSYWTNDFAVQYLLKSVIVSVEMRNIFNRQYPTYAYYDAYTKDNIYYPGAGRNYLLTLKVNLD